nr:immunoglobulin heavy chain junction region [Macaca mulatta]MOX60252.1 immunoglobulin heavy chain junction region [Macaca mulatta]MOX61472.1 immunoglobulin heavy chain junction region [Macaca mulatta]MOX61961.1 immunoglobulin heavy chain junction region [Macaca mulatta]MOX62052.1 immunoglobulin heavy chain junction region [Macaca mulatta]
CASGSRRQPDKW